MRNRNIDSYILIKNGYLLNLINLNFNSLNFNLKFPIKADNMTIIFNLVS